MLATDNGRAEVEFENGAMAFINENSVLEFFDLSLDDGSLTTRLILRQGTGSFYVNPAHDDYFSVTGGDFTAEAAGRANFRMDNFDDGSTVAVIKGQVIGSAQERQQTSGEGPIVYHVRGRRHGHRRTALRKVTTLIAGCQAVKTA